MQPVYFLKDVSAESLVHEGTLDRQALSDFELENTFRDCTKLGTQCQVVSVDREGPEGSSGSLLAYHTASGRRVRDLRFDPDWEWQEATSGLLMGIDPSSPPTETELRRKRQISGKPLEMEGFGWIIPECRKPNGATELPADIVFGDHGTLALPIKNEFIKAYHASSEALQWFFDSDFREVATNREVAELAIWLVGLNYRYGWWEQNRLRLIDTENITTILAWSVGLFDEVKV